MAGYVSLKITTKGNKDLAKFVFNMLEGFIFK